MAKDQDDELNTGVPGGEEFSLESILAEFGGEGGGSGKTEKKKKVTEDTIPFPMIPKSQRTSPPTGKPGRLLTFPERGADDTEPVREIVPPPAPPPEQEVNVLTALPVLIAPKAPAIAVVFKKDLLLILFSFFMI